MSDTPVYGFCAAGCKREVLPKDGKAADAVKSDNATYAKCATCDGDGKSIKETYATKDLVQDVDTSIRQDMADTYASINDIETGIICANRAECDRTGAKISTTYAKIGGNLRTGTTNKMSYTANTSTTTKFSIDPDFFTGGKLYYLEVLNANSDIVGGTIFRFLSDNTYFFIVADCLIEFTYNSSSEMASYAIRRNTALGEEWSNSYPENVGIRIAPVVIG